MLTLRILIAVTILQNVHSFNLDIKGNTFEFFQRALTTDPNNPKDFKSATKFGSSLSFVKDGDKLSLVVGAPIEDVNGAVYYCDVDATNKCTKITTSGSPNQTSEQLMGFSVTQSGDKTMSCAPHFHDKEGNWEQIRGKCSILDKDFKEIISKSPCEELGLGQAQFGYCTLGISISGAINGIFLVGAPGATGWQGTVFAVAPGEQDTYKSYRVEPPLTATNTFFGYSVVSGRFTASTLGDIAAGAPRERTLQGNVHMLTIEDGKFKHLTELRLPQGDEQTGAYFGASLAAVDLNADGRDDLLVGAPFYSTKHNEGRVYVFMNTPGTFIGLTRKATLTGESTPGGQFGTSMMNIGDVNGDGYPDVAISAPFGGPDGYGAVYIYNGGSSDGELSGIRTPFSQKIYASELPHVGKGFGYSMSQGMDVDKNGYTDVAIGSYSNGWVTLFKARPVVTLQDKLETNVSAVSPDVNKANCKFNGKNYQCIEFKVNLLSKKGPDSFDVDVTIQLDEKKAIFSKQRAALIDGNKLVSKIVETVTLKKGETLPLSKVLYFSTNIELDVLSTVEIVTSYRVKEDVATCKTKLCPLLDAFGIKRGKIEIAYERLCQNNICTPDLRVEEPEIVTDSNTTDLIFGSTSKEFKVKLRVENFREPAYQAMLKMNYSTDFTINGVEVDGRQRLWTDRVYPNNMKELSFALGNPISQGGKLSITVFFGLGTSRPSLDEYTFVMEASSFGNDTDTSNNRKEVKIGIKIKTCVSTLGEVDPPVAFYDASNSTAPAPDKNISITDIGQNVDQYFFIRNIGQQEVNSLEVDVMVMTEQESLDVVYIVDILANKIRCSPNVVNKYNLLIPKVDNDGDGVDTNIIAGRKRRAVDNTACGPGTCESFKCSITQIAKDTTVEIKVVSRLADVNLEKMQTKIASVFTTIKVSFGGPKKDLLIQDDRPACQLEKTISFKLNPKSKTTSSSGDIEWWWILLAVVGALILFAIVCAILYRIGFFKRKTLEDLQQLQAAEEEQAQSRQNEQKRTPEEDDDY